MMDQLTVKHMMQHTNLKNNILSGRIATGQEQRMFKTAI